MIRTLLVPLADELPADRALDGALLLAKRLNAHIRALYVRRDPDAAIAAVPKAILVAGATRATIERDAREAALVAKNGFREWQVRNGVAERPPHDRLDDCFAAWSEIAGEIEPTVTQWGRLSDMIVLQRFDTPPLQARQCFDAALFGSGRPTLVVPEKLPFDMTDHVVIAWNGSLEASRALFGAMPLLQLASRVSIFTAPQSDEEPIGSDNLIEALAWYGIHAYSIMPAENEPSAGARLIAAALRAKAGLIVMGAYTHSRLQQSVLGGVTRHLLAHSPVPLLMSH